MAAQPFFSGQARRYTIIIQISETATDKNILLSDRTVQTSIRPREAYPQHHKRTIKRIVYWQPHTE